MKVFSEESALQLSEMLLQNDKDIKTEIEGKIPSVEGLASEKYVDNAVKNVEVDLTGYATESFVSNAIANAQLGGDGGTNVDLSGFATQDDLKGYAKSTDIPTTLPASDVYDWAKAENKPVYTADEVGALPNTTVIPNVEGLATEEYVNDAIANAQLNSGSNGTIVAGYRDTVVIPDKYNTGCKGELQSIAEYFGEEYAEQDMFGINPTLQSTFGTTYENIHFDMPVSMNKQGLQPIIFKNCKFSGDSTYNVMLGGNFEASGIEIVFENCEFTNATSAAIQPGSRIKLINCKIHDMASDGGKVFDYGSYENCYFYNIGYAEGAHADGIQVTSVNHDFKIINCRFDMPYYDKFVPNAAIFFCIEEDSYSSVIKDCVMTGGNYTFGYGRKYPDATPVAVLENNTVENIIVGCSHQYGKLNDNSTSFDYSEVKDADKLFVSSVYKEDEKIKLLVTNYTNYERTLRVVTNNGEASYTIPACPLYADGLLYTSFSEFPFDIEYIIGEDIDYIICYDGDEQIRFVDFSGNGVNNSSVDLSNYYTKEEIDSLIPSVKDGIDGEDGFSPIATVEQTTDGAVITITDINGTTTATIKNGKDGANGQDGNGGSSNIVYLTESEYLQMVADGSINMSTIYITDKSLLNGNEVVY